MENYLNREKDHLFCVDINESEYLKNNLQPYEQAELKLGLSSDVLVDMIQEYKHPIANLVYIDGSHIAKHVMEDAILSWKLLKVGGIMIFDDYGWGHTESVENQPKTGIDAFLMGYQKHYQLLGHGWQVFIKKIQHEMSDGVLSSNYADNNKFFNKQSY
jgi:predicted O-methyltransferase YrrM